MTGEPMLTERPKQEELFKGNIIDEFTKLLMEYTDSPEIFCLGCSYYLVASTLGEFYINKLVPLGSQRPNLFVVLSSIPGRMRRSTVQRLTYKTFKQVVGVEESKQIILEEGTPEGITDVMTDEPDSMYTLQSTEGGIVFSKMGSKHYQAGMSSLLSKLYYGESGRQSLSKRVKGSKERFIPENLYVTMLYGMQEPHYYFNLNLLTQGLLRRLLILYVEKADSWKAPINPLRVPFEPVNVVNTLKRRRQKLLPDTKVSIILMPDAEDKINEHSKKLDEEVDKTRDNVALYRQSLWEHWLKLATIHAIAGTEPKIIAGELLLHVTMKDVEAVESMIKHVGRTMVEVIHQLGRKETPLQTEKLAEDSVMRYILEAGEAGIYYRDLVSKFPGVSTEKIYEFVNNLKARGKVKDVFPMSGKPGRPPRVLVAKDQNGTK